MPGNQLETDALSFAVRNQLWECGTTCYRAERPDSDELAAVRTIRFF